MVQAFLDQAPWNAQDAYQGVNAAQVMRLLSQHRSIPQPPGQLHLSEVSPKSLHQGVSGPIEHPARPRDQSQHYLADGTLQEAPDQRPHMPAGMAHTPPSDGKETTVWVPI